ncbi:MAG: GNAT family N-acetyltransferase [Candidatus Micrarchaeota archaeon]
MPNFEIRELDIRNEEEVEQVDRLYRETFKELPHEVILTPDNVRPAVDRGRSITHVKVFVAVEKNVVLGLAVGSVLNQTKFRELEGKKVYVLHNLAVAKEHRRRGIATALNLARLKHAQETKSDCILGSTLSTNYPRRTQLEKEGFRKFSGEVIIDRKLRQSFRVLHYIKHLR